MRKIHGSHFSGWLPCIVLRTVINEGIMKSIKRFLKGEEGVTAIEYALIAAGIGIAIMVVVFALGTQINIAFQSILDCLQKS